MLSEAPSCAASPLKPAPAVSAPLDISIIIPFYNIGDYLTECLESVLAQDQAPNFEVILVNDASTDASPSIAQDYCSRYPDRLRLISHPTNQGVAVARNTGVSAVRGTYLAFIDGDDRIPPNALRTLFDAAEHYQVDMVKGSNTIFDQTQSRPASYNAKQLKFVFGSDILTCFFKHQELRGHTWGKLMRTASFTKVQHPCGVRMAQDALYFAEVLGKIGSMALITDHVYEYRLRPGSTTNKKYETQAYLWWLDSIEKSGHFVRTPEQRRAYITWQLRTFLQIANEAKKLPQDLRPTVLNELENRIAAAELTSAWRACTKTHSVKWTLKFMQLRRKLDQLTQST